MSRSEECIAENYRLRGVDEGIEIDELGNINIDSTKSIQERGVQVFADIGGKTTRIAQFLVEVYDCSEGEVTFPNLLE